MKGLNNDCHKNFALEQNYFARVLLQCNFVLANLISIQNIQIIQNRRITHTNLPDLFQKSPEYQSEYNSQTVG